MNEPKSGQCELSEDLALVDAAAQWVGLRSVICVESRRWLNDKKQHSKCFYIRSLVEYSPISEGKLYPSWSIEKEQHGYWDVTFDEGACQIHRDYTPFNLTTVRKLATGLINCNPAKMSLKCKRKKAARDDAYLMTLLRQLNV